MSKPKKTPDFPTLSRLPEVKERTALSRATIYSMMAQGKFPRSIELGPRAVAWLDHEITDWINERVRTSRHSIIRAGEVK
jgi:prophage regulatory protein